MSDRARQVLRDVDLIACEDTRHSGALLRHLNIQKPLISLHEHNETQRLPALLAHLAGGKHLAVVSDAGTPLLSDPGFPLVRAARGAGLQVVPIPGPSSLLAALVASGLPVDRFAFEGFLPPKATARRERLGSLAAEERTLVFFEAGQRLAATLQDARDAFGAERPAAVARELTKRYEEIHSAPLEELERWLAADDQRRRGEFVLLIQGAPPPDPTAVPPAAQRVLALLLEELPVKRAAALAARITGVAKNALYQTALDQRGAQPPAEDP